MQRRGFLGAMLGAMAAPAIVKAENLMRVVAPTREIIVPKNPWANWTMERTIYTGRDADTFLFVSADGGTTWHGERYNGEPIKPFEVKNPLHDDLVMPNIRWKTGLRP